MHSWIALTCACFLVLAFSESRSTQDEKSDRKHYRHSRRILEGSPVPNCEENTLDAALAQFPSLEAQHLIKIAREKNLDEFCNDLRISIRCLHDTLKNCYIPSRLHPYSTLIRGIEDIYYRICSNAEVRKIFMRRASCLHNLLLTTTSCNQPKDWSESSDFKVVCRGYKKLIDCYKLEACISCGPEAAEVLESIFIMSLKATLSIDCSYCFSMTDILGETLIRSTQNKSHIICYIIIFLLFAGLMYLRYGIL